MAPQKWEQTLKRQIKDNQPWQLLEDIRSRLLGLVPYVHLLHQAGGQSSEMLRLRSLWAFPLFGAIPRASAFKAAIAEFYLPLLPPLHHDVSLDFVCGPGLLSFFIQ